MIKITAIGPRLPGLAWAAGGILIVLSVAWLVYTEFFPGPGRVIIEWTTASEVNTAGFNLYQAEQPDGSYKRVNPELIPSSVDPMLGGQYVYTDTQVISGRMYYYQLEDVDYDGATVRHGPLEARAQTAYPPLNSIAWWALLACGGLLSLAGFLMDRGRNQADRVKLTTER